MCSGDGVYIGTTLVVVAFSAFVVLAPAWPLTEGPSLLVFLHVATQLENPRGKVSV